MKYFTHAEFDSPDSPDSGSNMDESFLRMLDSAREAAGTPFKINSGFRTPKHNKKVGGSENSSHLRGFAADIHVTSNSTRYVILEALLNSRNKKAQELVRQGLRLYVNGEYGDAEELFQKAFQYDPTDLKNAGLQ